MARRISDTSNHFTYPNMFLRKLAFTLTEVLLSVSVVAIGLIGIMQVLAKEINALSSIEERIESAQLLRQRLEEITKELLKMPHVVPVSREQEIANGARRYRVHLDVRQLSEIKYVYEIRLIAYWKKFSREQKNTLATFLYKSIEQKNEQPE